jgi:fructose-1,6-bisphosphatase/inositol monophosphatase family enzyme
MDSVGRILRETAETAILPRFRSLRSGEIEEKSPGDHVTVADREAERLITARLRDLVPGSSVIGEELASECPEVMASLPEGEVWVVDPLDGTTNFVEGSPLFAVMVAFLKDGETVASWILQPAEDRLLVAERGSGAFVDGTRLLCPSESVPMHDLRGAALNRFMPAEVRSRIEARRDAIREMLPGLRCAGFEYPAVASAEEHFAVFWRTLPWDHAPGALVLAEAGGHVARLDGRPYRPAEKGAGLLVAQNRAVGESVRRGLGLGDLPVGTR